MDTVEHVERFLARHLKDEHADADAPEPCRVFRTGAMRWEDLRDWPAPASTPTAWHLASGGDARTLSGDGRLVAEPQAPGTDRYRFDPDDVAPDFTNLDLFAWSDPPHDYRFLLRRRDVAVYTGPELDETVNVSGQAELDGFVSLDAPDTDLAVMLLDVHPDGRMMITGGELGSPGLIRLSQRNGSTPEPLNPGEIVRVRIPMVWLHHSFLAGHRIAIAVLSSVFPAFTRNLNNGEPWADAVEGRPVDVTIHHGTDHPSRLLLPVEPAKGRP